MSVTLSGIDTVFMAEHPSNALAEISVTPDGIVTSVRPVQPLNALPAILPTGYVPILLGSVSAPVGFGVAAQDKPFPIMATCPASVLTVKYVHV